MRATLLRKGPGLRRRILLALVVLVPLLFIRTLSDPINVPKLALLIAGVAIVATIRAAELLQTHDFRALKRMAIPAGAMAVPLIVAWLFSPYKGWAIWGVYPRMLGLVPYLVVILFGVLLVDAFAGDPERLVWPVLTSGGLAGAYATLQVFGLDPFEWTYGQPGGEGNPVVSTLGNPNFAGALFAIVLPVGVAASIHDESRRIAAVVATAFMGAGLFATASQGAWIAAAAGLAVLAGVSLRTRWRLAPFVGGAAATCLGLATVAAVVLTFWPSMEDRLPLTTQRRGEWWEASLVMAASSPIVGRGPNSFALEHPRFRTRADVEQVGLGITDDPHSLPLSFLTAAGALGALGYLVFAGWIFVIVRGRPPENPWAAAFLAAVVAYLVQGLVSIDTVALRTAGWTVVAGLAASGVTRPTAVTRRSKKPRKDEPLTGLPVLVLAGLLGLFGLWTASRLISADASLQSGDAYLREGDAAAALSSYQRAVSLSDHIHYRRRYGSLLGDIGIGYGKVNGETFIEKAQDAFGFVYVVPHIGSTVDFARLLAAWSDEDPAAINEALDIYALALGYDPRETLLYIEASDLALAKERYGRAATLIEAAPPSSMDGAMWGNLALARARLGDVEAAHEALERSLALIPDDPSALEAQALLTGAGPGG